jgi:hypothetical protein
MSDFRVYLPRMKIGTLIHMLFLLFGDTEDLGGFSTSMSGERAKKRDVRFAIYLVAWRIVGMSNANTVRMISRLLSLGWAKI